MHRPLLPLALAFLTLASACVEGPKDVRDHFEVAPVTFAELTAELMKREPSLADFDQEGPFKYDVRVNRVFRVTKTDTLVTDVAIPRYRSRAPLVIVSHGNHSRKEAHRSQIQRLASYGFYAVAVQLPNTGQWMENGTLIAKLARKFARRPKLIDPNVDTSRIILAGHSFGGSAITVAAGQGAPVAGLVLLDPAVASMKLPLYMKKVDVPVMLIGADMSLFRSRKRRLFDRHMGGEFAEVSVRGATHDDAQGPSMFSLTTFGFDPYTSEERQRTFAAAITASAFSIAATGTLDYAWSAFERPFEDGVLRAAGRRAAP